MTPTEPTAPTAPAASTAPPVSTASTASTGPTASLAGTISTGTAEPDSSTEPTASTGTAEPDAPTEPTEPAEPEQDDTEVAVPTRRRQPPAWLLGVGAALVAVGIVLVVREPEIDAGPRDLSTPEGSAEAFARAAAAGDVDGVLAVTCLGHPGCAAEHGGGVTSEQIAAAKDVIADNMRELGARFSHAEFTTARDGARAGTQEVDYRLPGVPADQRQYLVFVEHEGRWLYIATGGPS